jgi:drug/metabolite transporter (DMT)-like permease
MLQRIQTVYMILALLSTSFYTYWSFLNLIVPDQPLYFWLSLVTALLILINIFLFSNRNLQVKLNNLAIFVLIVLLGLSIYQIGFLSGEKPFSEKDIKLLVPVISIVFLLIANKYIKRDERLVKSVDRIR